MVGTILAAAVATAAGVAIGGVVVVALMLAAACAVWMRGRRAPRPQGADAGGPGVDGGSAEHTPTSSNMQERWRRLAADLEVDLDTDIYGRRTTHAATSGAPVPRGRRDADATRVFAGPPADAGPATPFVRPVQDPVQDPAPARHSAGLPGPKGPIRGPDTDAGPPFRAGPDDATRLFGLEPEPVADATRYFGPEPEPVADATRYFGPEPEPVADATRYFGPEPEPVAWAPAHTRFFGPDELDDDHAVADHSADGPTGGLLALPPAPKTAAQGAAADGPASGLPALPPASTIAAQGVAPGGTDRGPASHALERVRERLSAVSTPQVVALSVIDSAGRVLAGTTDDDVTGELRSLMAESGLGNTADLVQPLRFTDDSPGAMLLLPTGANALLGALVRETDDLQATRARLRGLAREIGDAMRAAS